MRVVHVSKVKGIAGSERHLLTLLPALAARGVDVSMLVIEEPDLPADSFCAALAAAGIPTARVPIHGHLDPGLTGRLAAAFRAAAPDLVHTHLIHADLYGLAAARQAGVPHAVSTRHNENPFRRRALIRWLNRQAMAGADRVIAISEALAAFVRDMEKLDAAKVVTVRYGMAPHEAAPDAREAARRRWGLTPHEPVAGFFGRLIEQKGVDVLLAAFALTAERVSGARLVIVGEGDRRPVLEARARALGIAGAVTFAGWADDAPGLMPGCDVIAMPSRWEGFGMVALEAMNAARPLVASQAGALPEVVDEGETGLLVPPDDPDALAGALDALLGDPAHAAQMGQAGRARLIDRFSVTQMVEGTLAVYRDVYTVAEGHTGQGKEYA